MTSWLLQTLVWTGLLIGLVLLLRRPVGSYFGPKAAYALWLLPALRLIMPPLVLPAWLAPAAGVPQQALPQYTEYTAYTAELASIPVEQAAAITPEPIGWGAIILAVWLSGAVIFLAVRFKGYFTMRRALLANARPVGEAGPPNKFSTVRLVETPEATAPLAFGVVDKVVALPSGFMALYNREQRDFALAHELAHHAGGDLLANMAAQPLFALHWFNPLAWLGWRALRRDQEAACDARVISRRSPEDKATYAETIASFAASPRVSLAAPMACPVLGEKSIIHRLRSISMSDISPRRRFAGRALIGASLLALPLTASISYAETISEPAPPAPPEAPAAPLAPDAPLPPAPPTPPLPPSVEEMVSTGNFETVIDEIESKDDGSGEVRRVVVMRSKDNASSAPKDREVKRVMRFSGKAPHGEKGQAKEEVKYFAWLKQEDHVSGEKMSEKDRLELPRKLAEALADSDRALIEARREMTIFKREKGEVTRLHVDCKDGHSKDGHSFPAKCRTEVMASAFAGLKSAREEIARSKELKGDVRAEVLEALDEAIANWMVGENKVDRPS